VVPTFKKFEKRWFNVNRTSTSARPVTPGEWQVMADVRMVRHTTQTTVTEITFQKKKPLEA
jgi:hypothetical protein